MQLWKLNLITLSFSAFGIITPPHSIASMLFFALVWVIATMALHIHKENGLIK